MSDVPTAFVFTVTYTITFDPPDGALGWYVDVQWQKDGSFYEATRYGPIPFEQVELVRDELKNRDARMIDYLKEHLRRGTLRDTD